jgi:hypothetical protein
MAKKAAKKPTQSKSKVTLALEKLNANVATKSQAQLDREKAALKQAKLEESARQAYEKAFNRQLIASAKRQGILDGQKAAGSVKPAKKRTK